MANNELLAVILERLDRIEDKLDKKIEKQDDRIDKIEQDLSKAHGWVKAMLSVMTLFIGLGLEWIRRSMF